MPTNVIDIGQWRLKRRDRFRVAAKGECPHHRLLLDDRGEVVTCEDCHAQLSPYWVLSTLAEDIATERARNDAGRRLLREECQNTLHLTSARRVESLWQTGRLVPTCPHCRGGILAEDNLGSQTILRAAELRRRKAMRPPEPVDEALPPSA